MIGGDYGQLDVERERAQASGEAIFGADEAADLCHVVVLSVAGGEKVGGVSARGGPPLKAAAAGLVGENGQRAPDDRTARKRAEVATVDAVWDIPVHDEEFVVADGVASLPHRHLAVGAIALTSSADRCTVDDDIEASAA